MKNRAAYMTGLNKMEIREIKVPVPKEKQVLVKLEYVGICGSDVHYLEHGKIGDFVVNGDFILGHECAGIVESVGPGVENLKVGDRVALEPGITCGQCEFCKSGRYNLCPDVEFLATPPYHGCLMNYIAFPENMAFKLPESISTKEGALVEPLAVGMHAAKQGDVKLGDSVVILGSGTIGLVTLLACKAFGATDITVVDVIPKRLEYAKKLGATTVLNATEVDVLAEIDKLTNKKGVDIVIETAGSAQTIAQTPYLIKNGGRIVLVGMAPQDIIEYNIAKVLAKEAEIKSVFRYRNIYPQAINAIAQGIIDISGIITHEFDFEDVAKAFDFVINHKQDVVKAVIKIG
ncbi:NAD(P)-dependent alcohol dehydrogenase [Desulfosporosinus meridiei]|uniref:Theronine dehydrogenase-like Zn-dependent dehydrogenase n=1 Tax=Desulfosporosinus meridiei (strain ATCC BAA-275 / DSM 13257 / KCTC 12902 / NCIMB 13706 / S10) TaxID=768704 RepID=J7IZP7_DESMD|nr:NAD(P)-dependent alcohol dehydrogenase [Desulfosporosinus meridiei]AFQ44191.1 theronine dehydrogenase-like Zn-dependent dehydrogenase [Desulfosporosinus meridiei DSM 13257]